MRIVQRHVFSPGQRLIQAALMFGGRFSPHLWERWYWRKPDHRQALALLTAQPLDLIHVNEALTLPIGIEAARKTGARVLFDATRPLSRRMFGPAARRALPPISSGTTGPA
jgi:hypothetical protein